MRVNAINPGSIATERLKIRIQSYAKEFVLGETIAAKKMAKSMRIARFVTPEEIARAEAFLASPNSGNIHGSILDIDGGQTRTL